LMFLYIIDFGFPLQASRDICVDRKVALTVREEAMACHRTQKGLISKNVLAACDFDMRFTYILPGWKGSAADSTVLYSPPT
jgi:hypothetical protein